MSSAIEQAVALSAEQVRIDERLEEILRKHLQLDTEENKKDAAYQAWGLSALAAALSISNLFLSISSPNSGRSFRAITDLAYGLHGNEFWQRNSSFLMPMLVAALNAHKDYVSLAVEKDTVKEYAVNDKVLSGTQTVVLEIFSSILYLVGGPSLMALSSLPLRLELAPYFVK